MQPAVSRPRSWKEAVPQVSSVLLCALLVSAPLTARAQDTVTIVKNVQKTVTKTVNVVNGNGNVVGGNVVVGSITNNNNGGSGNVGSGTGDPLIRAFDGSLFFFTGEPGKFYNMISDDASYQVSALFKEANNAVHTGSTKNGTYMQAIGFVEENVKVSVETFADDSARMIVKVNGEELRVQDMAAKTSKKSLPLTSGGFVNVTFSLFQEKDGSVVYIVTPLVKLGISLVPPGLDHAGYWQPSYVNLHATLLANPRGVLQGVIGDTFYYDAEVDNEAATVDTPEQVQLPTSFADIVYPVFPDLTYELSTLFAKPQVVFSAEFIRAVVAQRRAIAQRLFRASVLSA